MKKLLALSTIMLFCFTSNAQTEKPKEDIKKKMEEQIRKYYFVMLLKGNSRTQDSVTAIKIQEGHLANINHLYKEGKLKVAGPFGDKGNWLGIFIFDCETEEEVKKLLDTDPAIAAGRLAYEIHPWYTAPMGSFKPGKPD